MRQDLPRGTVTFVFTDVEGSTRLLRQFGPERYAEALADHRRVLRDAFVREKLEALVLGADGPEFARARTEGRLLSIAEAAGFDAR